RRAISCPSNPHIYNSIVRKNSTGSPLACLLSLNLLPRPRQSAISQGNCHANSRNCYDLASLTIGTQDANPFEGENAGLLRRRRDRDEAARLRIERQEVAGRDIEIGAIQLELAPFQPRSHKGKCLQVLE